MTRKLLFIIFCMGLLCGLAKTVLSNYSADNPNDPAACFAAAKAVVLLGPSRGAVPLVVDIRNLVGLDTQVNAAAINVNASIEDLNRAVSDLGALVEETKITVELPSDVLFDFDKSSIKSEAETTLKQLAIIILKKGIRVDIFGHTDAKGDDAYNLSLSLRRAQAVKDWLIQRSGVNAAILFTQGLGEKKPVEPNSFSTGKDNPEGRAKNRRVEVIITTQKK